MIKRYLCKGYHNLLHILWACMLTGCIPENIELPRIVEPVDLGLSVKWASCNVGASFPEDYGDYFAWGETQIKSDYSSSNSVTYGLSFSELVSRHIIGYEGDLTATYDAATVHLGGLWRMPTLDEMQELINDCTWEWTTMNGVNGYKVIGPNGNSIFLPAAGLRDGSLLDRKGSYGYYWSVTLNSEVNSHTRCLTICRDLHDLYGGIRYGGLTVRPVYGNPPKRISVSTGNASDITHNSATLCGVLNNSKQPLTCGIIYDTSSTLSSTSGTKKSTTSSGSYSVTISGLKAKTTYYYRAYAIVDGEYKYGEVRSFTTDLTITTGEATEVTYSAATLGGTVNSGGQSVTCGIIYGTSSKLSSTSGTLMSTTSSGEFSVRVMGLSSNTIYYYCAYVVIDGEYKYGEVLSFTTETITIGDAIDLGLSVKWASWNVGADSPEGYGGYYAWGETEEKGNYDWSTYEWGSYDCVTKYCTISGCGIVDNKTTLEPEDDVAHILWGDGWRMPTSDELSELYSECSFEWATVNGVKGYKVTGPNGNSIFCPAAGSIDGTELHRSGEGGSYWSSTLWDFEENCASAFIFNFGNTWGGWDFRVRYLGRSVRPVYGAPKSKVSVTTGDATDISAVGATLGGIVSNSDKSLTCGIIYGTSSTLSSTSGTMMSTTSSGEFSIEVTGLSPNTTYYYCGYVVVGDKYKYGDVRSFTTEAISITAGDAIDLGLSVKWASCNIGANSPEEYGGYYAWGETEEKDNYDWSTYKWCKGSEDTQTKYCTSSSKGTVDNKTVLEPEDDVAHVKRGDGWRMPTLNEILELIDNCTWSWTTQNGVKGHKVTGPNGNSIFLPAAGFRVGTEVNNRGLGGICWSGTLYENHSHQAIGLHFGISWHDWGGGDYRYYGFSVRPVTDGKRNNSDVDLDDYPKDENWDARRRR